MSSITEQLKDDRNRGLDPQPAEVEDFEFLGVCAVLAMIYFLAPRPDLYRSMATWMREALEVTAGWLQAIL